MSLNCTNSTFDKSTTLMSVGFEEKKTKGNCKNGHLCISVL